MLYQLNKMRLGLGLAAALFLSTPLMAETWTCSGACTARIIHANGIITDISTESGTVVVRPASGATFVTGSGTWTMS